MELVPEFYRERGMMLVHVKPHVKRDAAAALPGEDQPPGAIGEALAEPAVQPDKLVPCLLLMLPPPPPPPPPSPRPH